MTFQKFYRLQFDAADCKDCETFLAEEGGSVNADELDLLRYVYTVSDVRAASGLSRAEFSRRYGIPLRTIEDWEAGRRVPPDYLVRLIAFAVFSDHPPAN